MTPFIKNLERAEEELQSAIDLAQDETDKKLIRFCLATLSEIVLSHEAIELRAKSDGL